MSSVSRTLYFRCQCAEDVPTALICIFPVLIRHLFHLLQVNFATFILSFFRLKSWSMETQLLFFAMPVLCLTFLLSKFLWWMLKYHATKSITTKLCIFVYSGQLLSEHWLHYALCCDWYSYLCLHRWRRYLFPWAGENLSSICEHLWHCSGLFKDRVKICLQRACVNFN